MVVGPAAEARHHAVAGRVCTAAGSLAAEGAAGYWRPPLGAALAAADVVVPAVIALILLTAILRGSTETCERAFRLLRWIAGRAEPPAPPVPQWLQADVHGGDVGAGEWSARVSPGHGQRLARGRAGG